jgi:cysteine desulfurase / selenocysteine lyase
MALQLKNSRHDFPLLSPSENGKIPIYLDSAATSQTPFCVLNAMDQFYRESKANVHRGMHTLAEHATAAYEESRRTVQKFIGAKYPEEIIFTKNSTEGVNLVARGLDNEMQAGNSIVLSLLEHHSNIVPWMQLNERTSTNLQWIGIDVKGNLDMNSFDSILAKNKVKLVAITMQNNVLGIRPPLKEIITKAHAAGALVLVDAAQGSAHHAINVQELDCDFLVLSGHKLYGPTGIGVLYGKRELLEKLPPFLGGGTMIQDVGRESFTPADLPAKFEAGTPPIAEAIGLKAAIDWLGRYTWEDIEKHEEDLLEYALKELQNIDGIKILGPQNAKEISGCISFTIEGIHAHDLTEILGEKGIHLRAGHHCAAPLHKHLGIRASTRLSVGIYNTKKEIDTLIQAIEESKNLLNAS